MPKLEEIPPTFDPITAERTPRALVLSHDDDDDLDADASCPYCFEIHLSTADDEACEENRAERRERDS